MGGAKRYPSTPVFVGDGYRFAPPILRRYDFAFSRRIASEVCWVTSRRLCQRAQGRPGACCTRGLACDLRKQNCTRAYRAAGAFRPSLRNGFTAYFVLSPENGSFASVAPEKLASQELSASTATPEPHDFAVRFRRVRLSRPQRPSHLTARS